MPEIEQAVADLMTERSTLDEIITSFNQLSQSDNSQEQSRLVLTLIERWRKLEISLSSAQEFLVSRDKELESKERKVGEIEEMLQNKRNEVESKHEVLLAGEISLGKRIKELELRQEEVKTWLKIIELNERRMAERSEVAESNRTKLRRVGIVLKHKHKNLVNLCKAVKLQESEVSERVKEVEEREEEISRRMEEVEEREKEVKAKEEGGLSYKNLLRWFNERVEATKGEKRKRDCESSTEKQGDQVVQDDATVSESSTCTSRNEFGHVNGPTLRRRRTTIMATDIDQNGHGHALQCSSDQGVCC